MNPGKNANESQTKPKIKIKIRGIIDKNHGLDSPPRRHWHRSCAPSLCRATEPSAARFRAGTHRVPVRVRRPDPPGIAWYPSAACQRYRSVFVFVVIGQRRGHRSGV